MIDPTDAMESVLEAFDAAETGEAFDYTALRIRLVHYADQHEGEATELDRASANAEPSRLLAAFDRRLVAVIDLLATGELDAARTDFRRAMHDVFPARSGR